MPPRAAKRAAAGPGSRGAGRGRAAAKVQALREESNVRAEEAGRVDEGKRLVGVEEKEKEVEHEETEKAAEENAIFSLKKDDHAKEPVVDYEKDEQLELEDNDPDYEPEEDGGVDYDEKEIEPDLREGDEVEEELEEADDGEEENYVVGDVPEDLEPEEGDEHVGEARAKMVDEEEEHQELFKERRKRKEFEIFVGGLDKDATESDLREVFNKVGEVTEVRLLMNPQTKKNRGFAFLRFATVEQAKRACVELKNPVVHGKQCGVTSSQDSDTLFIGNICRTWTKQALKEKLKNYGVESIEELTLVEDTNNQGMNRGFAFLEFASRSDAMDAFKCLQKRDVVFGGDRPAKVSFADSFIDPGDEIMAQVKTVFVDGLPASWDEGHVKELLKKYGEIEKVELARNMPSARRKDFGFVTFNSHNAAVTCAKSINNEELAVGDNKAKVRARLSRPLQRKKGKSPAHGDFRPGRGSIRGARSAWSSSVSRSISLRDPRGIGPHYPHVLDRGFRKHVSIRDRRPTMAVPPRNRPVAPMPRSYDRRPPVPPYPKSGLNRDYGFREEVPYRASAPMDYSSRFPSDRRPSYRDDYSAHGSDYPDLPRGGTSRSYVDDGYNQRYERLPITYREGHGREYDSLSGSKRPYTAMDDVPPRYAETAVRHSRARLDYDSTSASRYGDAYSDRLEMSNLGYGGERSSLSSQDSHGFYSGRHGMGYGGGSYGGSDRRVYSSSFSGDYVSRGSDVGGSSYSSLYPGRGSGSNSYIGSGGSGSYY